MEAICLQWVEGGDSALADSSKHSPFLTSVALVLPAFNLSQLLFIQEFISWRHSKIPWPVWIYSQIRPSNSPVCPQKPQNRLSTFKNTAALLITRLWHLIWSTRGQSPMCFFSQIRPVHSFPCTLSAAISVLVFVAVLLSWNRFPPHPQVHPKPTV